MGHCGGGQGRVSGPFLSRSTHTTEVRSPANRGKRYLHRLLDRLGRCASAILEYVLQRMIAPQLVELDIFLEALEGRVAGELLEAGDVDALRDATRDRARRRL